MSPDLQNSYFTTTIARDLFDLICGKHIANGSAREVFEYLPDPTKVIKFEKNAKSFQNILEWEAWQDLHDQPAGKWLAPCRHISACGTILIMDRTVRPPENFKWPKKIPAFLTDFKHQNYGLIGKQLVCHDYGTHAAFATLRKGFQKPKWWNENE